MAETKEIRIFNAHGYATQMRKLAEEQYELIESLLVYHWDGLGDVESQRAHVAEEMADCMVLMEQFRQCLGIEKAKIDEVYKFKVDRELGRIKEREEKLAQKMAEMTQPKAPDVDINNIIPF